MQEQHHFDNGEVDYQSQLMRAAGRAANNSNGNNNNEAQQQGGAANDAALQPTNTSQSLHPSETTLNINNNMQDSQPQSQSQMSQMVLPPPMQSVTAHANGTGATRQQQRNNNNNNTSELGENDDDAQAVARPPRNNNNNNNNNSNGNGNGNGSKILRTDPTARTQMHTEDEAQRKMKESVASHAILTSVLKDREIFTVTTFLAPDSARKMLEANIVLAIPAEYHFESMGALLPRMAQRRAMLAEAEHIIFAKFEDASKEPVLLLGGLGKEKDMSDAAIIKKTTEFKVMIPKPAEQATATAAAARWAAFTKKDVPAATTTDGAAAAAAVATAAEATTASNSKSNNNNINKDAGNREFVFTVFPESSATVGALTNGCRQMRRIDKKRSTLIIGSMPAETSLRSAKQLAPLIAQLNSNSNSNANGNGDADGNTSATATQSKPLSDAILAMPIARIITKEHRETKANIQFVKGTTDEEKMQVALQLQLRGYFTMLCRDGAVFISKDTGRITAADYRAIADLLVVKRVYTDLPVPGLKFERPQQQQTTAAGDDAASAEGGNSSSKNKNNPTAVITVSLVSQTTGIALAIEPLVDELINGIESEMRAALADQVARSTASNQQQMQQQMQKTQDWAAAQWRDAVKHKLRRGYSSFSVSLSVDVVSLLALGSYPLGSEPTAPCVLIQCTGGAAVAPTTKTATAVTQRDAASVMTSL